MTSFAFILVLVPEPVWKTSIGKCSSTSPSITSCAPCFIAEAFLAGNSPRY